MQKNYFISQESSRYSLRKQDWFFLLWFLYEWNLRWLPSSKDNAHLYIHRKKKQLWNVFIYKKPDTFQKARQFPFHLYIQKAIQLTLRDFHEIFEVGIYIQKAWHFALRDVFIYKKLGTSQKARQVAIRFYIQNPALLRYAIFHWIFETCGGAGHLFIKKTMYQSKTYYSHEALSQPPWFLAT